MRRLASMADLPPSARTIERGRGRTGKPRRRCRCSCARDAEGRCVYQLLSSRAKRPPAAVIANEASTSHSRCKRSVCQPRSLRAVRLPTEVIASEAKQSPAWVGALSRGGLLRFANKKQGPPPPLEGGGWGEGCVHPLAGGARTPPPSPLPQGEGSLPARRSLQFHSGRVGRRPVATRNDGGERGSRRYVRRWPRMTAR